MLNGISSQWLRVPPHTHTHIYSVHTHTHRGETSLQCNEQFAPNNSRRNITGIITLAKVAASFSPLNPR